MNGPVGDLVAQGRRAVAAGDAAAARAAVGDLPEDGSVLEVLAGADYLDLDFLPAIERWERAFAAHRAGGDRPAASRVARMLAGLYYSIVGDRAVSAGWHARAQTLVEGLTDTREQGWLALNRGMFEADRTVKHERFEEALDRARASGDLELEVATLAYFGASLVHAGDTAAGMQMLDEALAALAGDEVEDFFVLEEVFCQLFSACEHARDVGRADQWIRIGEGIATRRNLPAVSAFCRTHYGGVLTVAGRWPEADDALTGAIRLWGLGNRSAGLQAGALVRLADLRVRQGRFEEAEVLLADLPPLVAEEGARSRAAIHLAKDEVALAREVLERTLATVGPDGTAAAPLLEQLVEVELASGDLEAAEAALARLVAVARDHDSDYLRALAAVSRGRVCLASGEGDPRACLREALAGFERAETPLEVALVRLELAEALVDDGPEVALVEARGALEAFERLQAGRHADAAASLLRRLGVRATTARRAESAGLTRRETEVLELLGHGLTNPEIADRLFISRKTVEHHVGNVLAKLGLRSRTEAAAYVLRRSEAAAASGDD